MQYLNYVLHIEGIMTVSSLQRVIYGEQLLYLVYSLTLSRIRFNIRPEYFALLYLIGTLKFPF